MNRRSFGEALRNGLNRPNTQKLWRIQGRGSAGQFERKVRADTYEEAIRKVSNPKLTIESCVLID